MRMKLNIAPLILAAVSIVTLGGNARAEDLTHCKAAQTMLAKDPAGARAAYKLCLSKGKLSPAAEMVTHVNLANVAAALGKWDETLREYDLAEAIAKKAGKPFTGTPVMNYTRAVAYAETGELKRGRTYLDAAVKAAPKRYDFLLTRMKLLAALGETEAALADGATLIASGQPGFVYSGHANRAAILQESGRAKEALAEADKAIKVNPRESLAYNNRCMAAATLKRADAVASCEKAIALDPKTPSYWNSLGYAYEQLGKLKEAEAQYAKVAGVQPKNAGNNAALSRVRGQLE
jgi:tetratricopeptide (TPR) repeat protein